MTSTLPPHRCLFRPVLSLFRRILKMRCKTFWTTFSLNCVSRRFFLQSYVFFPSSSPHTSTWRFGARTTLYGELEPRRHRKVPVPADGHHRLPPTSQKHFELRDWAKFFSAHCSTYISQVYGMVQRVDSRCYKLYSSSKNNITQHVTNTWYRRNRDGLT